LDIGSFDTGIYDDVKLKLIGEVLIKDITLKVKEKNKKSIILNLNFYIYSYNDKRLKIKIDFLDFLDFKDTKEVGNFDFDLYLRDGIYNIDLFYELENYKTWHPNDLGTQDFYIIKIKVIDIVENFVSDEQEIEFAIKIFLLMKNFLLEMVIKKH